MNQKAIGAALEDADMEPMTYENPDGSTKAERTLAAAYREVDAALTAVCEERDKYHDDLEKAEALAGFWKDCTAHHRAYGDALAEAVEAFLIPNKGSWRTVRKALDKYRRNE